MADETRDQDKPQAQARRGGRKLIENVHVTTDDDPRGTWYGPDYPEAGEPPAGSVHDGAYGDVGPVEPAELAGVMELEGAATEDREFDSPDGSDGADRTGDRHRTSEASSHDVPRIRGGRR